MGLPPSVNPKFAEYNCLRVEGSPWTQPYDIKNDGFIGVDDMKALDYRGFDAPPIDTDRASLDRACQMTKILMLGHEVEWRLQELLAGFTGERLTREAALERIAAIEPYALKTLELLSNGDSHIRTQEQTRSRSVEMVLRARMFVGGAGAAELFGVGVKLAAHPAHADGFPLVFQTVQQFGTAAAAGLLSGDELIAIDGKSLADWSPDRTVQGLATLVNEGRSWITGPLNSNVQLTVVRAGDGDPTLNYQKTVTLRRTVWAPRTTSAPIKTPVWSGNEAFAPWHGFVP